MNKKVTIEQELLGTTKHMQPNESFVRATMQGVQKAQGAGTFERAIRTASTTKKGSFIMKLKLLPRFAVIGLTAASLTVISGGAYAAYQAWQQPQADVIGTQRVGDQEALLVALNECGNVHTDNNKIKAVISQRSDLTSDEAAKVIQAYCELAAIGEWASQDKQVSGNPIVLPYTVKAVHANSIEMSDGSTTRTVAINDDTVFLAKGVAAAKASFKPGDVMTVVTAEQGTNQNGPALAVIRLELPSQYYSPSMMQHVYQVNPCVGNPGDMCINAPSRDVYPYGKEGGALTNSSGNLKQIQGMLTNISNNTFVIKSTSGKTVTVTLADALQAFGNRNPDMAIEIGDTLTIGYVGDSLSLSSENVSTISLLMDGNAKTGEIQKF